MAETREVEELKKDEDWEADNVGYRQLATTEEAEKVIASSEDSEGRSRWYWIRLATGDLVLACYPCGDTYFATEIDRSI